jgi:hypothetical protein
VFQKASILPEGGCSHLLPQPVSGSIFYELYGVSGAQPETPPHIPWNGDLALTGDLCLNQFTAS